jgi:uncharacterized repeat protein (TIGR01451 family)
MKKKMDHIWIGIAKSLLALLLSVGIIFAGGTGYVAHAEDTAGETAITLGAGTKTHTEGTDSYTFPNCAVTLDQKPSAKFYALQLTLTATGGKAGSYGITLPDSGDYASAGTAIKDGYQMIITLTNTLLTANQIAAIVSSAVFAVPSDTKGTISVSMDIVQIGNGTLEDGWTYWNGSEYRICQNPLDWPAALAAAKSDLADLASIDSSEENTFLNQLGLSAGAMFSNAWVGCYKDASGNFVWSDGSSYVHWDIGQPQPGRYVAMYVSDDEYSGTLRVRSNIPRIYIEERRGGTAATSTVSDSITFIPVPTEPVKTVTRGTDMTNIDGGEVQPGDELTYAVKYTNTTGDDVTAVISDAIPEHTAYVADSADNGGKYDSASSTVNWSIDVKNGESVTVTFRVKIDDGANGTELDNTAAVNAGGKNYTTNTTRNMTPNVPTEPAKQVYRSSDLTTGIDGEKVQPGDELTYAVKYTNTTCDDVTAVISDAIPEHTAYVADSADNGGKYDSDSKTVNWSLSVKNGESITVTFRVKIDDGANGIELDNTAAVNAGGKNYTTNTTRNMTPNVPTEPVKQVYRSSDLTTGIDGEKVQPGDELTYAVKYTNTTGDDVKTVISDVIPEHTTYVTDSADNGGKYDSASKTVNWSLSVKNGESITVTFRVKIDDGANGIELVNTAAVNAGGKDYTTNTTRNITPDMPTKPVNTSAVKSEKAVPETGDHSSIAVYATLLLASGLSAVCLLILGKKHRKNRSDH